MLGSGKTPGGKSREEKRTVEPGRRLGKRALKIPVSVASHRHRHQMRHNCAAISANPPSQLTFRKDFMALNHHLHIKNCKR